MKKDIFYLLDNPPDLWDPESGFGHNLFIEVSSLKRYCKKLLKLGVIKIESNELMEDLFLYFDPKMKEELLLIYEYILTKMVLPTEIKINKKRNILTLTWRC